jgi:hypothetical protein
MWLQDLATVVSPLSACALTAGRGLSSAADPIEFKFNVPGRQRLQVGPQLHADYGGSPCCGAGYQQWSHLRKSHVQFEEVQGQQSDSNGAGLQ